MCIPLISQMMWCLRNSVASSACETAALSQVQGLDRKHAPMSRQILQILTGLLLLMPMSAAASDFDQASYPCRIERLEQALAACLGHIADRRLADIDHALLHATSGLQAATGPEILAFEANLAASQSAWLSQMVSGCTSASETIVEFHACRLDQTLTRQQIVDETLEQALADLGAIPAYRVPVPDAVEVLVPLVPPTLAGPDADIRVPLVIPIRP